MIAWRPIHHDTVDPAWENLFRAAEEQDYQLRYGPGTKDEDRLASHLSPCLRRILSGFGATVRLEGKGTVVEFPDQESWMRFKLTWG